MNQSMLPGAWPLSLAGEALQLLPERALWCPDRELLVVADVHFGKGAAFRAAGLPVPAGTTAENLAALDRLLHATRASALVFLGDFLHARSGRSAAMLQQLQQWRQGHGRLRMTLVRGNHDRHAGDPPVSLDLEVVDQPWTAGALQLRHEPAAAPVEGSVAGHIHPAALLAHGHERLRLPCFLLRQGQLVLPAFGAFTGGHLLQRQAGDEIFLAAPGAVLPLPHRESR